MEKTKAECLALALDGRVVWCVESCDWFVLAEVERDGESAMLHIGEGRVVVEQRSRTIEVVRLPEWGSSEWAVMLALAIGERAMPCAFDRLPRGATPPGRESSGWGVIVERLDNGVAVIGSHHVAIYAAWEVIRSPESYYFLGHWHARQAQAIGG
jgi:hypothetical protein